MIGDQKTDMLFAKNRKSKDFCLKQIVYINLLKIKF